MTATLLRDPLAPPPASSEPGWWGMALFIATEAMIFACLFAAYFFLWGSLAAFAAEGGKYPPIKLTLPMTFILLTSSVAMHWGERGIRKGDQQRLRIGMAASWILGAAFLVMQAIEYSHRSAGPTKSAYDSLFYTITGTHGLHVAVGLLMGGVTQVRAWLGHFTARQHLAVKNTALYWHFVDLVWLFVFTLLYLVPRLGPR